MLRQPEGESNQCADRVRCRTERHHRHIADVKLLRAYNPQVFIHNGLGLDGAVVPPPVRHAEGSYRVVHCSEAESSYVQAVPDLILRPGLAAMMLELGENLVSNLIQHREDPFVALLPTRQGGETRARQVVHPVQVFECYLGHITPITVGRGWFDLVPAVQAIPKAKLDLDYRSSAIIDRRGACTGVVLSQVPVFV